VATFVEVTHRVYLEAGAKRVFAVSLDWPGWCRSGRSEQDALEQLDRYGTRYSAVVGTDVTHLDADVVGTLSGNATTDFGAPQVQGPWDREPLGADQRRTHLRVLESCWQYLDHVVADAPLDLLKGPRGGGRTRDQITDHVRESERRWTSKAGLRIAPRTPWPHQRAALTERLASGAAEAAWPADFTLRIVAWHVLDHAWEIEDKTPSS